jgi:hypothetical protein
VIEALMKVDYLLEPSLKHENTFAFLFFAATDNCPNQCYSPVAGVCDFSAGPNNTQTSCSCFPEYMNFDCSIPKIEGSLMRTYGALLSLPETRRCNKWGAKFSKFGLSEECNKYDSIVISFGGLDANGRIRTDTWQMNMTDAQYSPFVNISTRPIPAARMGHTAQQGKLKTEYWYIFGGFNGYNCFNDIWLLDLDTHVWNELIPLKTTNIVPARAFHTATIIGKSMFVFGGVQVHNNSTKKVLNDIYILDTQALFWSELQSKGPLPPGRWMHAMALTTDMFIHGGIDQAGNILADTWRFAVATQTWTSMSEGPKRYAHQIFEFLPVSSEKNIKALYLFGGSSDYPVTSPFDFVDRNETEFMRVSKANPRTSYYRPDPFYTKVAIPNCHQHPTDPACIEFKRRIGDAAAFQVAADAQPTEILPGDAKMFELNLSDQSGDGEWTLYSSSAGIKLMSPIPIVFAAGVAPPSVGIFSPDGMSRFDPKEKRFAKWSGVPDPPKAVVNFGFKGSKQYRSNWFSNRVVLAWSRNPAGNAPTSFLLEVNMPPLELWERVTTNGPITEANIKSVKQCKDYNFRITSKTEWGEGPMTMFSLTTVCNPGAPTNFRVVKAGSTYLQLAWDPSTNVNPVDAYKITCSSDTDGSFNVPVLVYQSAAPSAKIAGLNSGFRYKFKIFAYNMAGPSDKVILDVRGATTLGKPFPMTAPIKLKQRTSTDITVSFVPPGNTDIAPVTGFEIQILKNAILNAPPAEDWLYATVSNFEVRDSVQTGSLRSLEKTRPNAIPMTSFMLAKISGLTSGTTYEVRIRAHNPYGNANWTRLWVNTLATAEPVRLFDGSGCTGNFTSYLQSGTVYDLSALQEPPVAGEIYSLFVPVNTFVVLIKDSAEGEAIQTVINSGTDDGLCVELDGQARDDIDFLNIWNFRFGEMTFFDAPDCSGQGILGQLWYPLSFCGSSFPNGKPLLGNSRSVSLPAAAQVELIRGCDILFGETVATLKTGLDIPIKGCFNLSPELQNVIGLAIPGPQPILLFSDMECEGFFRTFETDQVGNFVFC